MRNYRGIVTKQRAESDIRFITFRAYAKDIVNWCHADDISLDHEGVQRSLVEARWKQISKFYKMNPNNIIPNGVVLAFDENIKQKAEEAEIENDIGFILDEVDKSNDIYDIKFSDSVKSFTYIIDGQHRLKGMSNLDFNVPVIVTLFLGIERIERAFQFITINNKSHKVPTDNIKALIANFETFEDNLRERLSTATITSGKLASVVDIFNEDPESPFYKSVDWVNNRHTDGVKIIQPLAIENSLKTVAKGFTDINNNDDIYVSILMNIWNPIKEHYGIKLDNILTFKNLFMKATIMAITDFVVKKIDDHIILSDEPVDVTSKDVIEKISNSLFKNVPNEFWKEEWKMKGLDSQAGRQVIVEDIKQIIRNINIANTSDPTIDWRNKLKLFEDMELS